MQLKLAFGIDELKFGITKDAAFSLLGNPDKIQIDEDSIDEIICDWNSHKLRLTFYKIEDFRLGYIRLKNENLTYRNLKIIGQPLKSVLENVFKGLETWKIEEYTFFSTYFNEEFWLTLHSDYGIVEELEIGVPFKNESEYDWPQ